VDENKYNYTLGIVPVVLNGTEQAPGHIVFQATVRLEARRNGGKDGGIKIDDPVHDFLFQARGIVAPSANTASSQLVNRVRIVLATTRTGSR
jgi:hypothetical protein